MPGPSAAGAPRRAGAAGAAGAAARRGRRGSRPASCRATPTPPGTSPSSRLGSGRKRVELADEAGHRVRTSPCSCAAAGSLVSSASDACAAERGSGFDRFLIGPERLRDDTGARAIVAATSATAVVCVINCMTDILLDRARTPDVTWTRALTRPTCPPNASRPGVRATTSNSGTSCAAPLRPKLEILPLDVKLDKAGVHFRHYGRRRQLADASSSSAARRSMAAAARATSASTCRNCFCSMASRTPGIVFTP